MFVLLPSYSRILIYIYFHTDYYKSVHKYVFTNFSAIGRMWHGVNYKSEFG